jgi:hypothetical protein
MTNALLAVACGFAISCGPTPTPPATPTSPPPPPPPTECPGGLFVVSVHPNSNPTTIALRSDADSDLDFADGYHECRDLNPGASCSICLDGQRFVEISMSDPNPDHEFSGTGFACIGATVVEGFFKGTTCVVDVSATRGVAVSAWSGT